MQIERQAIAAQNAYRMPRHCPCLRPHVLSRIDCLSRLLERRFVVARVLVVDDEPDATEALCQFLRQRGHEAMSSPNGREALAALPTIKPDVVVLDLLMPQMDGVEFLEVLRNYYRGALMPVILLTALSGGPFVQRALKFGVKRVFLKGDYNLPDLLDCVNELAAAIPSAGASTSAIPPGSGSFHH
jgi:CheY-like chemotaxis protein